MEFIIIKFYFAPEATWDKGEPTFGQQDNRFGMNRADKRGQRQDTDESLIMPELEFRSLE